MTSKQDWLDHLGDEWLERNRKDFGRLPNPFRIFDLMDSINIKPANMLEVGCSNGWWLKVAKERYGCQIAGVDPSSNAIFEALKDGAGNFHVGTADELWFKDWTFDVVVMGFLMWALHPSEWLQAVAESDRVLKNGGYLIIVDAISARPIQLNAGEPINIKAFRFDWPKLWLAHPSYRIAIEYYDPNESHLICILHKDIHSFLPRDET